MKKIALLMGSLAMLIACEKEDGGVQQPNAEVTIGVNQEQIVDAASRVAISENGNKFVLNWEGVEELLMTSSTSNTYTSAGNGLEIKSYDGANATFTGELPSAGEDVTVTNYYAGVSSFMSRSVGQDPTTRNFIRMTVANNQEMNGANLANSCILLGEMKDCEVGTIVNDFSLKTMNAFIKIPVKLGAAAAGATNTYANGMKLQSVKIEAVGGEQLAGTFGFDLNAADWSLAYGNDTNIKAANKMSAVTLNCNNAVLTSEVVNLYVAVAFGTYAQGLKVTFNVIGDNDKAGVMEKTIKSSGLTLARNTMLSMPTVAVTPKDASTVKYKLINKVAELSAGTYYMAGRKNDGTYAFTTAMVDYGQMVTTTPTTYANESIDMTGAVSVTLEAVSGKDQTYLIKTDEKYLGTGDGKNKLTLSVTASEWKAADGTTDGIVFVYSNDTYTNPGIYLASSTSASSKYVRGYTSSQSTGVFFFKEVSE